MLNWLKQNKFLILLVVVMAVGAFLRSYNYSDWLHFELDQSRDAKVIDLALEEGVGNLPMLGPRAAGTFLRLGPASYYLSYFTALLFGGSPTAMAYISLICGVGAIPLMYLFLRRYFKIKISLVVVSVMAVSLFMIMYSRFMWNPNIIPFFALLTGYALLRAVDKHEHRKELWLLVMALALAIVTQLHFVVFMGMPVIVALFLIIKRPKLKLAGWAAALGMILLVYSPVIINDVKTGGANFREFIAAFAGQKDEESKHNFDQKGIQVFNEVSRASLLVTTGIDKGPIEITKKSGPIWLGINCGDKCRQKLPWNFLASILLFIALIALLLKIYFYVLKKDASVSQSKKDFLILVGIWSLISFGLYFQIAYDISPRFFLFFTPMIFVYLGLLLKIVHKYISLKAVYLVAAGLLIINVFSIKERFYQLSQAHIQKISYSYDGILSEPWRVTYKQQNMIVDYMQDFHRQNGFPVYLRADSRYHRSLSYLVEKRGINVDGLKKELEIYRQGNHFLIFIDGKNLEKKVNDYKKTYDVLEEKRFGTLVVFRLTPKDEAITDEFKDFSKPEKSSSSAPERFLWNEVFNN